MTNFEALDRRQVAKLQSYLANNEAQLQQAQLQIDTQWSNFQDIIRRNTKHKMHIPCLDGIYQRMTKLKDMLASQRVKINFIHAKLKQHGFYYKPPGLESAHTLKDVEIDGKASKTALDSLTDSILCMSISQAVQENRAKLSPKKLNGIRQILEQRHNISRIKPRRPDRVDLNSEVILETKLRSQRALREGATASLDKMLQQQEQHGDKYSFKNKDANMHMGLAKPMATKAVPSLPTPNASKTFNFSSNSSSFVKTSAASSLNTSTEVEKPAFATAYNFSLPKGTTVSMTPKTQMETSSTATPISFAAKVIGGDTAKPTMSKTTPNSFKPDLGKNSFAALSGINTSTTATTVASSTAQETKAEETKPLFATSFTPKTSSAAPAFSFGGLQTSVSTAPATSTPKTAFAGFGTTARKTEPPVPVSAFSGFGKAIGELATLAATLSTTITTTTTAPAASNTLTFATKTTASVVAPANTATTTKPVPTEKPAETADSLFAGLNVCKPNTKEADNTKAGNIFGSTNFAFGGNMEFGKTLSSATTVATSTTTTTTADKTTSEAFTFTNALGNLAKSVAALPATTTTTQAAVTTSTVATTTTAPAATSAPSSTTTVTVASPVTTSSVFSGFPKPSTTVSTSDSGFPGFGSATFGMSGLSTAISSAPSATTTMTTSSANTSIFGSASGFSNANTTSSPFGQTVATSSAPVSGLFASAAAATSPPATGNIFGSIPKPEQSIFANTQNQTSSSDNIFGNAAKVTSPFGQNAAANNSGSIFGGSMNNSFGAQNTGSIFGGAAASTAPATNSIFGSQPQTESVFGVSANKSAEGGNLFGGGTSIFAQNQTSPGFGGNAFAAKPAGFGQTGSIFGGGMQNSGASAGSIFGGGSSGGFGSPPSSSFGGGNAAGAFAQGGASVAQQGFGSPQAAASPFAKPVFGGAPTFGSPPAFGAQPSFGGGPLFSGGFGSPPAAAPMQNNAFNAAAAPKDNIFEQLGAQDSGLSFGNLAQNTNANAPAKPAFGGSSFMKYRA